MPRNHQRRATAAALALLALPLLAGCAGPTPYSDFDRTRDERDVLPDLGDVSEQIEPDSVRFVGTAEGVDVYLGSSIRGDDHCVIVDGDDGPFSGCSGAGDLKISQRTSVVVQVHPDGVEPEDSPGLDWTTLGKNVSVRPYS
ncbi:hypothetical protein [Rathayibacter sp. VKM Ac-2760]|uniref:hypothetical protein n=1 Tax=Rathayibacter sp. VKM Ac-2760 TaxID=2609253 RepID=UPI00131718B8|nr:hypothetical protein [Rathayibacter sp. VKM Ac-2760]QHC58933.1 hypothetical protein GSU72_10500 [Rathayibacter sp. VKM Ac-2760]